ncbi:MAG: FAD-dependent oxidoreductase [Marinobacter sp.]|uniref:NAD(P)/FAD-dependent oxidoreductase n=1 Tax=Marinobacter sp. TaxID=50741 RepID=UPI003F9C9597
MSESTSFQTHQVVVIGAGAAGTSVAASLLRQRPGLDVAIVEPSDVHYYQPAFTLVGGGAYSLAKTARPQASTLPTGARWVRAAARELQPEHNRVVLEDGREIGYEALVVTPGLKLDWDKITGLRETLGRNGVCSNYDPSLAAYTWQCIRQFRGGKAFFTQPPAPIKCAGAPQKIAYLAADYFRKKQISGQSELRFYAAGGALFSVPDFVPHLEKVARRYNIGLLMNHNLVAVNGDKKEATFRFTDGEGTVQEITESFDLLHVTPPQCAQDFVKNSPLANADGWVDVDQHTLQHVHFGRQQLTAHLKNGSRGSQAVSRSGSQHSGAACQGATESQLRRLHLLPHCYWLWQGDVGGICVWWQGNTYATAKPFQRICVLLAGEEARSASILL